MADGAPRNATTTAASTAVGAADPTVDAAGLASAPGALGTRLGRYLLGQRLGEGGMGVVLRARDPDLLRDVAIKVLRDASHAARSARLLREAQAMARLRHPGVITIYEVGSDGGRDFIAMELIEGPTLATWMRAAPRRWQDVVRVLVTAGRGLAAAHRACLVHRDFKPGNVLIADDGRVLVTDFGLARTGDCTATDDLGAGDLTVTGAIMGTPAYMSPEQHRGEDASPASDQFAFCVSLWEALHGERPFSGAGLAEVRDAVLAGAIRDPARPAAIPARLARALRRGLAVDPAARHPSMDALLVELEALLAPKRRTLAWILAAVIATVVVVAELGLAPRLWDRAETIGPLVDMPGPVAPNVPGDPLVRAAVEALRRDIATRPGTGDDVARAKEWLARARRIGWQPLVSEAQLALAMATIGADVDAARVALDEAVVLADEAGADRVRARALVELAGVEVSFSSDSNRAERAMRRALAAVQRAGAEPALKGRFELVLADYSPMDRAQAETHLRAARALYERAGDHDGVLRALGALAHHFGRWHEDALALAVLEECRTLIAARYGEGSVDVARVLEQIAVTERRLGRIGDARRHEAEARRIWATPAGQAVLAGVAPPSGNRTIRGRVVDAAGAPVAGADVFAVAGSLLRGDGTDAIALSLPSAAELRSSGLVTTTSGPDGRFEVTGLTHDPVRIVAEHASGRAAIDRAGDEVTLALAPFGSLRGEIRARAGIPPGFHVHVVAESLVAEQNQRLELCPDAAGHFHADRVPAGPHWVMVVGLEDHGFEALASKRVVVAPGARTDVSLDLGPAGQRVLVAVRGERDVPVISAGVILFSGHRSVRRIDGEEAAKAMNSVVAPSFIGITRVIDDVPVAVFSYVPVGPYTVCAGAAGGDLRDPAVFDRMNAHRAEAELVCKTIDVVAGTGKPQTFSLDVPLPRRLAPAAPAPPRQPPPQAPSPQAPPPPPLPPPVR